MNHYKRIPSLLLFLSLISFSSANAQQEKSIELGRLPLNRIEVGVVTSKANTNYYGGPITIGGKIFSKGIGIRAAVSALFMELDGKARHFTAMIGHDDTGIKNIGLQFYVIGDEKILFESKPMYVGDPAIPVEVDLKGIQKLGLLVLNPVATMENRTLGNWAEAIITTSADTILPVNHPYQPYLLTPKPAAKPRITGPTLFGVTPGNPFLFTVTATGERPMKFSAKQLPEGLRLDAVTGIITGKIIKRGKYQVTLIAENAKGKDTRLFTIETGDTICLTPPLGWNGWNAWGGGINREKLLASAKAMKAIGLDQHGWSYFNIDDTWEGQRGGPFNALQPNEKFADMKGMVDALHAMGFKAGLYSTPWVATYAGYPGESSDHEDGHLNTDSVKALSNKRSVHYYGKYRFEKNDAAQWADWGIDFLKYDWPVKDLPPTIAMNEALRHSGRDILFSLSNNAAFEKAADWARLSNSWRTGGDIKDNWHSVFTWGFLCDKWAPFAGHGHWNDQDMLVIGQQGMSGNGLHPSFLTADEQYTHISLWALQSAPLIIGCPIETADDFTINLLSNDEVLDVNQDALGLQARQVSAVNGHHIWSKQLADGSIAVGLFNTGNFGNSPISYFNWGTGKPERIQLEFNKLGLQGSYTVRDLWRQKDLGTFNNRFSADVPYHGVLLIRLIKK